MCTLALKNNRKKEKTWLTGVLKVSISCEENIKRNKRRAKFILPYQRVKINPDLNVNQ
jgi:hypothetical protein